MFRHYFPFLTFVHQHEVGATYAETNIEEDQQLRYQTLIYEQH